MLVPGRRRQTSEQPSLRGVGSIEQPVIELLDAFALLAQRGGGGQSWAAPFRHHPIAFLLDTMSDAANLWGDRGELLYRNRAAEVLGFGRSDETPVQRFDAHGRIFERRSMHCHLRGLQYTLELIRELAPSPDRSSRDAA
jgi:hypothetical protein